MATDIYLPSMAEIERAVPRNPKRFRFKNFDFASREEALARVLNARARQQSYARRCEFSDQEMLAPLPLETWALSPVPGRMPTPFSTWFSGEPADSSYRVLIHYNPDPYCGDKLSNFWRLAYDSLRGKKLLQVRHKVLSYAERHTAKPFLRELALAYGHNRSEAEALISRTGHPYFVTDLGNS